MQALRFKCMRRVKSNTCGEDEATMFAVKYLGQGELEKPGLEDMCKFVDSLCKAIKKSEQKYIIKGNFTLSRENCYLKPSEKDSVESPLVFRTRRIQFCGVYGANPKIFFFTYQFGKTADLLQCHAFKCKSRKEAKCLAKEAGLLFKDLAFSLNRRLKQDTSKSSRSPLSSLGSQTSSMIMSTS